MANREIFGNQGPVDPKLKRSTFDKSFTNNLTLTFGKAYPVFLEEAPPNSSYSIDTAFAFDFMPFWYPVQNNITAHLSYYRVPFRILMRHYKRFASQIGPDGRINGTTNYTMPYIKRAPGWCKQGSLADYMGLPTNHFSSVEEYTPADLYHDHMTSKEHAKYGYIWHCGSVNLGDDGRRYLLKSLAVPVNSTVESPSVRCICVKAPSHALADTCKIRIPFVTANQDREGADITASTIAAEFVADSVDFNVVLGDMDYNVANSNYGGERYPILHHKTDFGRAVYSIERVGSYSIGGVDYQVFNLVLTLDPNIVARYNGRANWSGAKDYFAITWLESKSRVNSWLCTRAIADFVPPVADASAVSIEPKDDEQTGTIMPAVKAYGVMNAASIFCQVPLSGASTYFDSVEGADPVIPINALPFRAYEFIHNYFFRNSRVDPFIKYDSETGTSHPFYDEFITNDGDGADATTPVDFFNVPWEYDMFSTCVKEPFFGNAPLVGITTNSGTSDDVETATFSMTDTGGNRYTFDTKVRDGKIIAIDYSSLDGVAANTPAMDALAYAIDYGISISDFRNANALQKYQEKFMRAGTKFPNILEEFYGSRPNLGEEYPVYLGGVTRRVQVNKVTNLAQSDGNPLGDFAGSGNVRGNGNRIKCFCAEPCYIIGIMYFTTTPLYSQMLPKHFIKSKLLDYYNPLFANISPQPVYRKQLAPLQLASGEVDEVFGYNRPWADYVSRQDEVHGEFRGSMADFLFQRLFYYKPQLNKSFLEIDSRDLTNIFSNTEDNDKIFGQIRFDVRAKLPIPRFSMPTII